MTTSHLHPPRPRPFWRLSLIDRYLLGSMAPPMAAAFAVVLISLLLYRILEIFNLLAASSAQFDIALRLIGALLPHYLGLALPAGFFISVLMVLARMSDNSEIDALLASGLSMERLAAPFVLAGVVVAGVSLLLLGFAQPYGRYDYNLGINEALGAGWNARLQPRTFVSPTRDFVMSADIVDPTGRALTGVFVRRIDGDGQEQVITARRGLLVLGKGGAKVTLILTDVGHLQDRAGSVVVGRSERLQIEAPAGATAGRFRARGNSPRELTSFELVAPMRQGETDEIRRRATSEFHQRMVRAISPPFLPLMAIPLGMAAKRGRRTAGFILAAVALMLYEYGLDLAQSLADLGRADAIQALWTPFALFSTLCLGLFLSSRKRPGETPFNAAVDALGWAVTWLQALVRRRPSSRQG